MCSTSWRIWPVNTWYSKLASRRAALDQVKGPTRLLLILHIFCVAVAVPGLMKLPLPRASALLEPRGRAHHPAPGEETLIVSAVLAVLLAGRPLVRRGCLTRGVTLYYFLRRAGVDVSLCFGVGASSDQADGFDGHCWLVKDGEPFLEARDPRRYYTQLYSFPQAPHPEKGN